MSDPMFIIPPLSPRDAGRLNVALMKKYRFDFDSRMIDCTLQHYLTVVNRPVSKHISVQTYSRRKICLEYKKLAKPKTYYNAEFSTETSISIPKIVYDVLNVPETKTLSEG